MLRARAAHCQPGYHLGLCSACSSVESAWEEGAKASLVLFISLFLIENSSFSPFGSMHAVSCCHLWSENWYCISLYFGFTSLNFLSVRLLYLFSHLSPQASHSIAAIWCSLWLCSCFSLTPDTSAASKLLIPGRTGASREPAFSLWLSNASPFLSSHSVLSLLPALSSPDDSAGAAGVCAALSLVYPVY